MIKKAIIVTLFIFFTLNLGACNVGDNKLPSKGNNENRPPMAAPIVEKVESKKNQQKIDTKNDADYMITKLNCSKSEDKLKYNIKYPQISRLNDKDKERRINSILKNEALKVLKYYQNSYGSVEINIDYEVVLKKPNILSIQYWGVGNVSNAAHPNSLFFTTNINIKTGDRLRLKDVVNIDNNFAHMFLNGEFTALQPEQSYTLKHLSIKDVQDDLNEADSLDNIGTEKQSDVFSYFTNDSLGISINVGHALGGHAEFEIKYQVLNDDIKTENSIWDDL